MLLKENWCWSLLGPKGLRSLSKGVFDMLVPRDCVFERRLVSVAGVRKRRERELGRETTREGGGRTNWIQRSTQKNAGGRERRAGLQRSARRQQFIIKVSSWRFYNWQEEVLNQKSPKVIDRFAFNYLAVDNVGQTAHNKHIGSMIFPFFLLASKTDVDKPLGDDTF